MKDIYIIGSGGFGREILETLKAINKIEKKYEIIGFIDDDENKKNNLINGYLISGTVKQMKEHFLKLDNKPCAVIAIADAETKKMIANTLEGTVVWENIIHPTAIIADTCKMGRGNLFQAFSLIGPNTIIGNHCMLNVGSGVGHDVIFEDFVSVMSNCDITGGVVLKENVYVSSSVSVIPGCIIGESAKLGAGSTIFKNVKPGVTMHGHMAVEAKK